MLFKIKICGITTVADAEAVVSAGGDAIGLNFFTGSKRFVSVEEATRIAGAIGNRALKVGVFVNSAVPEILDTATRIGLDLLQLHGDEPADVVKQLGDWPVLRAFRCSADQVPAAFQCVDQCLQAGSNLRGVLIDAFHPNQFGGTGQIADWSVLKQFRNRYPSLPLVLAGGLTPNNVGQAILTARPDGVDTASGVESAPGRKDSQQIQRFVAEARKAFTHVPSE